MTRWEESAARSNARSEAKAPLFAWAGLVPHITADEQQERVERVQTEQEKRFAELRVRQIERARQLRGMVGYMAPEQMPALEKRLKALPDDPAYVAAFWHERLVELDPQRGRLAAALRFAGHRDLDDRALEGEAPAVLAAALRAAIGEASRPANVLEQEALALLDAASEPMRIAGPARVEAGDEDAEIEALAEETTARLVMEVRI